MDRLGTNIINSHKKIYLENFSVQFLFWILFNKKGVSQILVLDSLDFYEHNPANQNIYEKAFRKIFHQIEIIRLPEYIKLPDKKDKKNLCWQANIKTLEFLDSDHFENLSSDCIKPFLFYTQDKNIELAAKKYFAAQIFQKILFYLQWEDIAENHERLIVFESNQDIFLIRDFLFDKKIITPFNRPGWFKRLAYNISAAFLVILSPFIIRDIFRRGLNLKKIIQKSYDTAIHLVIGFPSLKYENSLKMRKTNYGDDIYFKYNNLDPSKNIFVQGRWDYPRDVQDDNEIHAKQMGSEYVDDKKLRIPLNIFLYDYIFLGIFRNIFVFFTIIFRGKPLSFSLIFSLQKIYQSYLYHLVFCQYIRVKIFISRDDYDIDHITRTIIQDSYGLKNFGIAHSTFIEPLSIPFSAHLYFHKYYTAGEGYRSLWHPYWENNHSIYPVGPHRDHAIVKASEDSKIEKRFHKKYKGFITILLLWTKPDNINSPEWLINKKYKGIEKLFEIHPDIHLIVRPRNYESANELLRMFPKLKDFIESDRMTIELDDFITQELVPFVNIMVGEDGSSAIIESAHRTELFLLSMNVRYPSFKIHEDICAENMEELIQMISNFLDGKDCSKIKDAHYKIKDIYTVKPPGQTWFRISEDIQKELNSKHS